MIDQSWLQPKAPADVEAILAQLRSRLEEVYFQRLRGLYLYGSYARGEAGPGSDLDVLLVLDRVFEDSAADRSYYAMFCAVEALLAGRDLDFSSHGAVLVPAHSRD